MENTLTKTDIQKKAMIKALENTLGIVSTACSKVGIARQTHYEWMRLDEIYKSEVRDIKNYALDFAESQLLQCIKDKRETSIIFYLKTQGKERGYIERQEIDAGDNNVFRVEIIDENNPNQ
jgi:hypothetical protein